MYYKTFSNVEEIALNVYIIKVLLVISNSLYAIISIALYFTIARRRQQNENQGGLGIWRRCACSPLP